MMRNQKCQTVIYVGDAGNVIRRLLSDHCRSNVEGSALRRHIAEYKGWSLSKTRRPSGSTRVRIDLPDPIAAEKEISSYIRTGSWRYILCATTEEAKDFQWYVIDKLVPLLNVDKRPWKEGEEGRFQVLLQELLASPLLKCNQLHDQATGPGVYVFSHDSKP